MSRRLGAASDAPTGDVPFLPLAALYQQLTSSTDRVHVLMRLFLLESIYICLYNPSGTFMSMFYYILLRYTR